MVKEHPATNLIDSVFVRPKMYTLTGSYGEVVAFLTGFYSGLAKGQKDLDETPWASFCVWLARHLNVSTAEQFDVLYQQHQADSLNTLVHLYREYKSKDS